MSDQSTPDKKNKRANKPRDMDTIMLFGCTGFVGASIGTYILTIWPHIVFLDIYTMNALFLGALAGMLPALIVGGIVTRKFGLPGAAGFLGGSMASGVFFYLRLRQALMFRGVPQAPQPEYPDAFLWMIPLGWVLITVTVIFLLIPRDELTIDSKDRP
ncbi:MAG: hypothetical protein KF784_03870 [Fimbriimonadaceae bacterium]|nr:hypothetical protein [Fimbriimonadaceae bacterium]